MMVSKAGVDELQLESQLLGHQTGDVRVQADRGGVVIGEEGGRRVVQVHRHRQFALVLDDCGQQRDRGRVRLDALGDIGGVLRLRHVRCLGARAVAVPPQALRASRTASPAAAVWILFLVFMVLPFKWVSAGVIRRMSELV